MGGEGLKVWLKSAGVVAIACAVVICLIVIANLIANHPAFRAVMVVVLIVAVLALLTTIVRYGWGWKED